ncbi:hypothetical protein GSU68_01665 [Rathayibacter sp. VKM Ac-2759]|uniref:hypothetical protein n=1 Tax=Rathayibacter sp. VKM Ac-2759 TaxID=2609252 RepID=UPI0013163B37|nr:hypothetical protein [Rathayibacter sp. VKM Ac-2759]QHC65414.1 hypothetical protein GSU68_01665 [Rathayibacter sp. VKM Ac-2759]
MTSVERQNAPTRVTVSTGRSASGAGSGTAKTSHIAPEGSAFRGSKRPVSVTTRTRATRRSVPSSARSIPQARERAAFLIESLGSGVEVAKLLDVNRSQPSQWSNGQEHPGPRTAQMLLDLDYVVAKALQAWSPKAAIDWLSGSNSVLDGARPIDVLKMSGSGEVIKALDIAMA